MMIERELANYLANQGFGTLGTDIFVNKLPETPDDVIAVVRSGSRPPVQVLSGEIVIDEVGIQVQVRGTSVADTFQKISSIRDTLIQLYNTQVGAYNVLGVISVGTPLVLRWDERNRVVYIANFDVAYLK